MDWFTFIIISICSLLTDAEITDWNALYQGNIKVGSNVLAGDLLNTTVSGKNIWSYPGIKYATARRFSDPTPNDDLSYYGSSDSQIDKYGPVCWQSHSPDSISRMDEDCLYLDILVPPVSPNPVSNHLHPVLFWVHGSFGAGDDVFGGVRRKASNLVETIPALIVPVQYRTGVFGFLSTEDHVVPGNWGLADLKAAFEWVFANIELFGGDNKRIVLGGHDSGASLVSAMMLDPSIRNRVHGTFLMSGSILAPWAMSTDSRSDTMKLAALMNCSAVQMTSTAVFNCLAHRNATDIVRAADAIALTDPSMRHTSWKLVVDGRHILYDPIVMLDDRHPWSFPGGSVYTVQTADALPLIAHHKQHLFGPGLPRSGYLDTYINDIIPMGTGCHALPNVTMDALIQKYNMRNGDITEPDVLRFNMLRLANDFLFITPIAQEAALYAINGHASKGTQIVMLDYDFKNEQNVLAQKDNLLGTEFGTSVKLLTSSNHPANNPSTLLTKEFTLMLNTILQRGYGLAENFDPIPGNYLELGQAKRWTKKRSAGFLAELNFHDFLVQQGCMDPAESRRQRSGVFSRDLSNRQAPMSDQPTNPMLFNPQPMLPPPLSGMPNLEQLLQNLTLLANDALFRNMSALKDLRLFADHAQAMNFPPNLANGRNGFPPMPPQNIPFSFPPNQGPMMQPPNGAMPFNVNQGMPRGGPRMDQQMQPPPGGPVLPPGQNNLLPQGRKSGSASSHSTGNNNNGRNLGSSPHSDRNTPKERESSR